MGTWFLWEREKEEMEIVAWFLAEKNIALKKCYLGRWKLVTKISLIFIQNVTEHDHIYWIYTIFRIDSYKICSSTSLYFTGPLLFWNILMQPCLGRFFKCSHSRKVCALFLCFRKSRAFMTQTCLPMLCLCLKSFHTHTHTLTGPCSSFRTQLNPQFSTNVSLAHSYIGHHTYSLLNSVKKENFFLSLLCLVPGGMQI